MTYRSLSLILVLFLLFGFSTQKRKFPEINYTTIDGQSFTNADLMGKKSVVILFHIGCPAAMMLLKDIETFQQQGKELPQIVGILENTEQQVLAFNDTSNNDWSVFRKYFKISPVQIPLIAECETEKSAVDKDGNPIIPQQCRKLSKKIHTRSSPTLVYVNEKGRITDIFKGWYSPEGVSMEERLQKLLN